jgi:hypothetical protein
MQPQRNEGTIHAIGVGTFALFVVAFLVLFNWHFPAVGHDYGFVLAGLLEGAWHFKHAGMSIPRYALHLCGGSVQYGHPLDFFYSPAQVLSLFIDPWLAIQATILLALGVGYAGWYRFARTVLRLPTEWSHVLSLVMLSNGFYFIHLFAGHFTYHAFSLLGWFLLLLLDRESLAPRRTARMAALFTVLCGYTLYSGNWFVFYFLVIGFALILPVDLYVAEQPAKRFLQIVERVALYMIPALGLMASKLVAIYSYMRFFPRTFPPDYQDPAVSTLWFVVKALWMVPQHVQLTVGIPGEVQEKSFLIAPVTLVGLLLGLGLLATHLRGKSMHDRIRFVLLAGLYGGTVMTMMVELAQGYGWFARVFHELPVGASQHVSTRYVYPFSLLLAFVGVWSLAKTMGLLGRTWNVGAMLFACLTTVATFVGGYASVLPEARLEANVQYHRSLLERYDLSIPVTQISPVTDFISGTSRDCYDPILNFSGNPFSVLHVGPVRDAHDGYFNLMNPACYQYPEENHCKPGDRIAVSDAENLSNFVQGNPVTWKLSETQSWADVTTLATLFMLLAFLAAQRYLRTRVKPDSHLCGRDVNSTR